MSAEIRTSARGRDRFRRGHCATERLPNDADFIMFAANLQNCRHARRLVSSCTGLIRASWPQSCIWMEHNLGNDKQSMAIPHSVVVVDGNTRDRTSTVTLLEAAGYRVRSARSFDEAKTLLAAECPDLLITDLRLGQYNGLHLVLRTRSDLPRDGGARHQPGGRSRARGRGASAARAVHPVAADRHATAPGRRLVARQRRT